MATKNSIEVCLSPDLLHLYDVTGKTVVVTDILRATSCMVTAFAHGAASIKPYADLEECRKAASQGYETSGERNGIKVEGFDRGNSPFEYMHEGIRGKNIAFTTTNGTQAIEKARNAKHLLIGAFLNVSATADMAASLNEDLIIVCAGWKGRFNLEDTLFAGALVGRLESTFRSDDDALIAAVTLYREAKKDIVAFLNRSSHVQRLNRLNIHEDMAFCVKEDEYSVVPALKGDYLTI